MDKATFFEIYDDTICPIIDKIIGDNPTFDIEHTKSPASLYECYLLKKISLRSVLKNHSGNDDGDSANNNDAEDKPIPALLDRHKIAACLTAAIIDVRLLSSRKTNEQDNGPLHSLKDAHRLNEQLAFMCGLSVLSMFMATKSKQNERVVDEITNNLKDGFIFPPPVNGKACPDSLVRALYFSHISYGVNPILMASIYYLLEQYFYKCFDIILDVKGT
ncbi:MAG: hypothetical protein FWF98_05625 [Dehalococcoidia bacterium]|nr:hypothetical protein [Dehalococcoidia bacterium]